MPAYPRAPKRHREVRCFDDCEAQYSGDPADCHCLERDEAAYEAECDRRLDAWRDHDHEAD